MRTPDTPFDAAEWNLAAAQLEDIILANEGTARQQGRDAILRWHMRALEETRAQAWIPGLGNSKDPVVQEALSRFYRHHMRIAVKRLKNENLQLRRALLDALACARYYARCEGDSGLRARRTLERFDQLPKAAGADISSRPY